MKLTDFSDPILSKIFSYLPCIGPLSITCKRLHDLSKDSKVVFLWIKNQYFMDSEHPFFSCFLTGVQSRRLTIKIVHHISLHMPVGPTLDKRLVELLEKELGLWGNIEAISMAVKYSFIWHPNTLLKILWGSGNRSCALKFIQLLIRLEAFMEPLVLSPRMLSYVDTLTLERLVSNHMLDLTNLILCYPHRFLDLTSFDESYIPLLLKNAIFKNDVHLIKKLLKHRFFLTDLGDSCKLNAMELASKMGHCHRDIIKLLH